MSAEDQLPPLTRPPTYATADPRARSPDSETLPGYARDDSTHRTVDVNHQPDPNVSFEAFSASNAATYELYNTFTGLNVKLTNKQLYYIGRYEAIDTNDLIVYGGYDQHGPQLGLVKFVKYEKYFNIYLGGLKTPDKHDWDTVRCATEGRFFHTDSYRFEVPVDPTSTRQPRQKLRLHWMKTHDAKLGASKFSMRDFKLVDEANDEIVAVYIEHSLGTPGQLKGKLEFRERLGENVELAALIVVMALIEKMRRVLRQAGRQSYGYVLK